MIEVGRAGLRESWGCHAMQNTVEWIAHACCELCCMRGRLVGCLVEVLVCDCVAEKLSRDSSAVWGVSESGNGAINARGSVASHAA